MNTQLINQLVTEYKADPNCWAALWIADEPLTAEEKTEFIRLVLTK